MTRNWFILVPSASAMRSTAAFSEIGNLNENVETLGVISLPPCIRPAIDSCFQHHFVTGIGQLWPPLVMNLVIRRHTAAEAPDGLLMEATTISVSTTNLNCRRYHITGDITLTPPQHLQLFQRSRPVRPQQPR